MIYVKFIVISDIITDFLNSREKPVKPCYNITIGGCAGKVLIKQFGE